MILRLNLWKILQRDTPDGVCLVAQLCLILCDPMDYIPPGCSVHGILQARILEWVFIPFSRGSSLPRNQAVISCIAVGYLTAPATRKDPPERGREIHSLIRGHVLLLFREQQSNVETILLAKIVKLIILTASFEFECMLVLICFYLL